MISLGGRESVLAARFHFQETSQQDNMKCTSVRKKGSLDPCPTAALRGHSLCGRHARAKIPTLWATAVRAQTQPIVKFQALVRGWLVRLRLRLAGPGVLSRKNLANDEELVTCESKDREHPLTYFAFEENGKVWWFSFESIWRWARQSHEPLNPYTKVPLSQETRKRLRGIWSYMKHREMNVPDEPADFQQRLTYRWNLVSQAFADHGFVDIHPAVFVELIPDELRTMFVFLERDIEVIVPNGDYFKARALRMCRRGAQANTGMNSSLYRLWSVYALMTLLTLQKEPYSMSFMILSALYRC